MTSNACFLSSEPVQEGRPDQPLSQLPPARLYPWEEPRFQVQNPGKGLTSGPQRRGPSSPSPGTSGVETPPPTACAQGASAADPMRREALPAMGVTGPSSLHLLKPLPHGWGGA